MNDEKLTWVENPEDSDRVELKNEKGDVVFSYSKANVAYMDWKINVLHKMDFSNWPQYKLVNFGENNIVVDPIKKAINNKGLCLVEVILFEHPESEARRIIVPAMIDSGATQSLINKKMADGLGLQIKSQVQVVGAINGNANTTQVNVAIQSLATITFEGLGVIIHEKMEGDFDFIIGADMLTQFKFERNGPQNTFTLSAES